MLFRADRFNRWHGHVGLSLGRGRMLSALDVVRTTDVAGVRYWREAYLGWSRAPRKWPGRLPLPFDLVGPIDTKSARFVSPGFDASLRGVVRIEASAPMGARLKFAAYYSDDPGRAGPTWREIGTATPTGSPHALQWDMAQIGLTHVFDWDTTPIIDQGDMSIGTVMLAAITIGGNDSPQGVGDYRRVSLDNSP